MCVGEGWEGLVGLPRLFTVSGLGMLWSPQPFSFCSVLMIKHKILHTFAEHLLLDHTPNSEDDGFWATALLLTMTIAPHWGVLGRGSTPELCSQPLPGRLHLGLHPDHNPSSTLMGFTLSYPKALTVRSTIVNTISLDVSGLSIMLFCRELFHWGELLLDGSTSALLCGL